MMIVLPALLSCLLALSGSATADPLASGCYGGNYTAKSPFQSNLSLLLASLSSSSNATFLTADKGSAPDRAYGLVLCRGDVGPADCAACIKGAAKDVTSLCPVSRRATVWYDNCQLRYADLSFLSTVNETGDYYMLNPSNATDIEPFIKLETELLDAVTYTAAHISSVKFATGMASNGSGSPTIYALAQCTRDLSSKSCSGCLRQIRGYYDGLSMSRQGGRLLGQSCNFRYESYPFFGGTPTISLHLSAPPPAPDAPLPSPASAPDVPPPPPPAAPDAPPPLPDAPPPSPSAQPPSAPSNHRGTGSESPGAPPSPSSDGSRKRLAGGESFGVMWAWSLVLVPLLVFGS